jgi:hypothetical protein
MKKIVLGVMVLVIILGSAVYLDKAKSVVTTEKTEQVENKEIKSNFEITEEKALKGDAQAQNDLGNMYANGTEVEQSYQEALKLFESAAKKGYAQAQFNLGTMYQNAIGVDQDFEKAAKYYKLAASQGHAEAKENLQVICEENPELCK